MVTLSKEYINKLIKISNIWEEKYLPVYSALLEKLYTINKLTNYAEFSIGDFSFSVRQDTGLISYTQFMLYDRDVDYQGENHPDYLPTDIKYYPPFLSYYETMDVIEQYIDETLRVLQGDTFLRLLQEASQFSDEVLKIYTHQEEVERLERQIAFLKESGPSISDLSDIQKKYPDFGHVVDPILNKL